MTSERREYNVQKHGLEYVEWCQDVLMEVLDELNISEEFEKEILNLKEGRRC